MLTIAGGIILALIIICALPLIFQAIAWLIAVTIVVGFVGLCAWGAHSLLITLGASADSADAAAFVTVLAFAIFALYCASQKNKSNPELPSWHSEKTGKMPKPKPTARREPFLKD